MYHQCTYHHDKICLVLARNCATWHTGNKNSSIQPFINDISHGFTSGIHLFANDYLLYRQIENLEDELQLQWDLSQLDQWSLTWGMKFNPTKCYVVSISWYQVPKFSHLYTLCNTMLEHHKEKLYLSVLISQDVFFTNHIYALIGPFGWSLSLRNSPVFHSAGTVNPMGKLIDCRELCSKSDHLNGPDDCKFQGHWLWSSPSTLTYGL